MEAGDGVRAWLFLRRVAAYRAAWRTAGAAHAEPSDATVAEQVPDGGESVAESGEPGGQAFPIRLQTEADLEAARFDLLAWQDPRGEDDMEDPDGPASPFWIQEGMTEAAVAPGAEPLAGMVAAEGGTVEGLRLLDGGLVLKVEFDGRAVQLLLRDTGPFPADGGIELRHPFGLRMPQGMRRLLDFWDVAGRSPPPP